MRRGIVLALGLLIGLAPGVWAQIATGNIYAVVNDESGGTLPGASVTISGATIGARSTTADSQGNFRFLNLDPGTYKLAVGLAGFATVNRDVVVNTGSNVNLTFGMKVASVEETITVNAETPVIDTKKIGTSTNFTQEELSKVPNSRDPWALLRTVPGVLLDRVNVAGNESGQQSEFVGKGSSRTEAVWNLDGVNITDMAATGASPTYFDYDAFEEIQISTGGSDIRHQTAGVGLNFVTKRGTNSFHGTLRGYFTHDDLESCNVPDSLSALGVKCATADHNKQIADYGFDLGGPIVKDRLWFWGSWGKQDIRLVRSSGNLVDKTILKDTNVKMNWQATSKDMISVLWFVGAKEKYGRATGNAAFEPVTATWDQLGEYPDNPFHGLWKIEDNHIFSPSFYMSAKYAYYGTGFSLNPKGGLDTQAGISPLRGSTFGSTQLSRNVRPQHTGNLDFNYFANGLGGSHEFRFGTGYRTTEALTETLWPGDQVVGFENSATNFRARVYRQGLGVNVTNYSSAYLSDTFVKDRFTLNVGVRYDHQGGKASATDVIGNGAFPNLVPGISFGGYEAPFTWSDISPRVGITYALDSSRKTLVRASVAQYVDHLSTGEVGFSNPSGGAGWAEYPWTDRNGDHLVQPSEVTLSATPLTTGGGFNAAAPTAVTSANVIDPSLEAPRAREAIVGLDRELFPNFALSVSYTYRRNTRQTWTPRVGMTPAECQPITSCYTSGPAVTGTLPGGQSFNIPTFLPIPARVDAGRSGFLLQNRPDYYQTYSGFEVAATKRLSNRWMMRVGGSYNNYREYYDAAVPQNSTLGNPTRIDVDPLVSGGQATYRTAGSGAGDVFLNGKWGVNMNAMYQLPWDMEIAGNLFGKHGTPFPVEARAALGRDGTQRVLVSPEVDSFRFQDIWSLDLRLAKNQKFGNVNLVLSADMFNVFNSNYEINKVRTVTSTTFQRVSQNLSPRILRFGVRLGF